MKTEKILIYPSLNGKENKYIENLYNTIKDKYEVIGYDKAKKNKEIFKSKTYHFNWFEDVSGSNIKRNVQYIKKMLFIKTLKIMKKNIIWTVHNNIPHDSKNKKTVLRFMEFMAKNADRIHILCLETLKNNYLEKYKEKIVHIPHGDYINNYEGKDIDIYQKYGIPKNKKIMIFIGQVRKYKNIELLIKAFIESKLEKNDYILLICGKCNDELYKQELSEIANNNNIYFDFNFINDNEMKSYLNMSEVIVAPYNKKSSLNSGTLWMCMSYSRTMILPLIGCIEDIKNYNNLLYVYDYKEEKKHYDALLKCLLKIKSDINTDSNILEQKGKNAYKYILQNQTWKVLKEKWIDLYKF